MSDLRQAAQQALEAWDNAVLLAHDDLVQDRMDSLRTALEQQAEPVATMKMLHTYGDTTPPQRKPLTDGWQPIETAPKDEIVLLSLPLIGNIREGDRRVYEGRWHEAQATWTSVNGFLLLGAATDWMPLPQPPIEAKIKEGT